MTRHWQLLVYLGGRVQGTAKVRRHIAIRPTSFVAASAYA